MSRCDAFLVLAEVPAPGSEGKLARQLTRLKEAFTYLIEKGRFEGLPIALLLNKWDRLHDGRAMPEERRRQARAFLASEAGSTHRALEGYLASLAKTPENLAVFAVSAWGGTRRGQPPDEADQPAIDLPLLDDGRLTSFGVEDPFVWAARRKTEIELGRLRGRAGGTAGTGSGCRTRSPRARTFAGATAFSTRCPRLPANARR